MRKKCRMSDSPCRHFTRLLDEDDVEDLVEPTGDQLEQAKFLARFNCVAMLVEGNHPESIREWYPQYSDETIRQAIRIVAEEYPPRRS